MMPNKNRKDLTERIEGALMECINIMMETENKMLREFLSTVVTNIYVSKKNIISNIRYVIDM